MDDFAPMWLMAAWHVCWQGGLALLLAWTVARVFTRVPAVLKSWLWRLAYIKLLVAFFWITPINLPLLPALGTNPSFAVTTDRLYPVLPPMEVGSIEKLKAAQRPLIRNMANWLFLLWLL